MCREVKVQAYASLDALAHTLKEIVPQKFGDTLTYLQDISYTLVEALRYV